MAIDIGPKIGIEGEAEYRRQINQIITQSKTLSSEMRVVASSFTAETTAEEKAAKTAQVLSKQVDTQKEKVKLLSDQLEKSRQKYGDNSEKTLKWQQAVNNATADLNKMERELSDTQKVADGYGQEVSEASEETRKFDQTAQLLAKQQLAEFWNKAAQATRKAADAALGAAKDLDKGYDTIVKKTGATGDALEGLKDIANDIYGSMAVDMDEVGEAIGEVNTRFGATGEELGALSQSFLQFSSITGTEVSGAVDSVDRIMNIFKIDAADTENVLGLLAKAGQDTGISIGNLMSTLDANGATLQELGIDLTTATEMLANFEANGVDANGVMTALKKAVQNAAKQGKDANDVLADAQERIKNAATETEALQIASETFGTKGAIVMAQGIRDGRISLDEATESIEKYGDVVSRTYEATLDPWDKTKIAMNNLKTVGSELAQNALATLAPAIEKVTGLVQKVSEWFQKLSPTGQKIVGVITALAAGAAILGPKLMTVVQTVSMLKTASTTATAMKALQKGTEGATGATKGFTAALLANPIVAITAGIIAAAAAVAALTYALADASDESVAFKDNASAIADAAKENSSSVQELADSAAASVAEMQAQEQIAGELADTIETLSKKENKSAEEVEDLRNAVRKLNSIYPDLNLQYDEAADNLSMTNDELRANIKLTQDQAKTQAYAKIYNELLAEQMQLQIDQLAIQNQLNAAQEESGALIERAANRKASAIFNMDEQKSAKYYADGIKELSNALTENERAQASSAAQMEVIREEMAALGIEIDPVTGAFEGFAEAEGSVAEGANAAANAMAAANAEADKTSAWNDLSAAQQKAAQDVAKAYTDMKDAVVGSLQAQMDMFEAYTQADPMDPEKLLANMQSQIDGIENWEQNLNTLVDRGINQDLLQTLLEMGPKGAHYVQTFVNMSDDQLRQANEKWKTSLDIKGFTNDTAKQLNAGIAQIASDTYGDGLNLGKAMARGITDAKAAVIAAAKDVARSARTSVQTELQIASPSKVGIWLGEMFGEGFNIGMEDTMPVLSPWNDVNMVSGTVGGIDPDAIYSAVREGASNAETKIVIGSREFGRLLRGMGVVMA